MKITPRFRTLSFTIALCALVFPAGIRAEDAANKPTPSANDASLTGAVKSPTTISDAEILDVITRVAKHQIHALADGDYAEVKSVEEAKAAKAPEGISWGYPWGVALYGVLRSTDAT